MDPSPYLDATCGLPTKIAERKNSLIETSTTYPPIHDQPPFFFPSPRFLAARLGCPCLL